MAAEAEQAAVSLIETAMAMNDARINFGVSGNVSCRVDGGLLITPSGQAYDRLGVEDLVLMDLQGEWSATPGRRPSSEWRFHLDIYRQRDDIGAVLHAHPINATALAVHARGIEPFHYMVAVAGGSDIRCAKYATFGTQELSDSIVLALEGRLACLIAHHGIVACGRDLGHALALGIEVETLAAQYIAALQLGEPPLLSEAEMTEVIEKMGAGVGYGSS